MTSFWERRSSAALYGSFHNFQNLVLIVISPICSSVSGLRDKVHCFSNKGLAMIVDVFVTGRDSLVVFLYEIFGKKVSFLYRVSLVLKQLSFQYSMEYQEVKRSHCNWMCVWKKDGRKNESFNDGLITDG